MEMMACPHCGAQNSAKRDYCYECQGDLRSPAKASTQHDYVPTCASCARALISAPLGRQLAGDRTRTARAHCRTTPSCATGMST